MVKNKIFVNSDGFNYLYDQTKKKLIFVNEILMKLIEAFDNSESVDWYNDEVKFQIVKELPFAVSSNVLDYNYNKLKMFLNTDYISKEILRTKSQTINLLTEDMIKSSIATLTQLTFEVTDRCNLNCTYCGYGKFYNDYDIRHYDKHIDTEIAKTLLRYISKFSFSNLNTMKDRVLTISFYGGEPLLNMPFIKEIVEYSKHLDYKDCKIAFNMTTNALLLSKHIDFLSKNNFRLLISLDGDSENNEYRITHNEKNSFELILKNVDFVKENYSDFFEKNVNFNAVLHNKNSVEQIYYFFKKRYNKKPRIGDLNSAGLKESMIEEFENMYKNSYQSILESNNSDEIQEGLHINSPFIRDMTNFIHEHNEGSFKTYNDFFIEDQINNKLPTGTCVPFSKKIFVTVNGKLLACESISQEHYIGTVTREKVDLDFKLIANKYNTMYKKFNKMCDLCYMKNSCKQCLLTFDHGENPNCKSFTNIKKAKKIINYNISILEKNRTLYKSLIEDIHFD